MTLVYYCGRKYNRAIDPTMIRPQMLEAYKKFKALKALEARLPEDAEQIKQELHDFLDEEPLNTRALFTLALCHLHCDETDEAKNVLETLLANDPAHVAAKAELAKIHYRHDDSRQAIALLQEAASARPDIAEYWRVLSDYLRHDGQEDASANAAKQYAMIRAFNDKLHIAQQAFLKGDFRTADASGRQLLQLVPNEIRTLTLLARIARQFGHYEFSTSTIEQCVVARPGDVSIGMEYAFTLLGSRRYREALEQCQKVIDAAPEIIDAYDLKAELLFHLGEYEEAINIYRELSEIAEKRALSLLHLGKVLKTVGETAEATACYQQAIDVQSTLGQAYWELADLKTYRFSDDEIASMRNLLEGGKLSSTDSVLIRFALGKALEDAQRFRESFQYYEAANSAYLKLRPSRYHSQNDRLKSFFTADYFAAKGGFGNDTDAAIFVVGLPRSGSTLVEQILSSHSLVDATQELEEIVSIARAVNDPGQPEQGQYPQVMANMTPDQVQDLAQRYLDYAKTYRQQAPYFVDKAPHNFLHIGLIKTLFPRARIIDVRRNPMASGWSLYRQFFADSYPFSYSLETIGQYYRDYIDLMNHWHTVLPEQILTVNYEDLVNDLPATVNSMLQYCGLGFEEQCLNFHLNERAVATPSSEQVRQPLYSDALAHWKNYESFLEPLKQALDG